MAKVYGFKHKHGGCLISDGHLAYYDEIMKYLDYRNGEGWKEKYDDEVKKLNKEFYNSGLNK